MSDQLSCKHLSSSSGEHLYGTAPETKHWFLLEYRGHWEKEALKNSKIPQNVKDELSRLLESFPQSRLQLIKKPELNDPEISFYYVNSSELNPKIYKFTLNGYEEIISLKLSDLINSEDIKDLETEEKLALVCTHGSYDRCCGTYGIPVYNKISSNKGLNVWQSTHVGAHRFSANLVMLPEGIYYGRVNAGNAENIVKAHLNGEIYLECLRGRCCYNQTSQVADYFLRERINKHGIYDLKWEFEKDRDVYTATEFRLQDENVGYSVNAVVMNDAIRIKKSCNDEEPASIPQFYFYSLVPYTPDRDQVEENS